MSWLEENQADYELEEMLHIEEICENLNDITMENIYKNFENNYYFMVCDILKQFKEGKKLTDKQIKCIARFVAFNDLDYFLQP